MDHYSYYQTYNHPHDARHSEAPVPHLLPPYCNPPAPAPASAPTLEPTVYSPASPSDFIYNSANTTASIFYPSRTSRPSHSWFSNEPASTLLYPQAMGYGPSRPVELSLPTYLPSLPRHSLTEPTTGLSELNSGRSSLRGAHLPEPNLPQLAPGFEEHRRQRKSKMNMGPGPSKSVPPPLDLDRERPSVRGSNSSSSDSTVVIKRENFSSSPIPVLVPTKMKEWEPKIPAEEKRKERIDSFDNGTTGTVNEMGSGSENGIWKGRGESVMEKVPVMPTVVPNFGTNPNMGFGMGMGMQPPILPKLGLFKPINWDSPSSRSRAMGRRLDRAWEMDRESGRIYRGQSGNENGYGNRNKETDEKETLDAHTSSSSCSRSAKRRKTSAGGSRNLRTNSAETVATIIKQEPGLSPPPSAIFSQIPMYNYNSTIDSTINGTAPGYGSSSDDNTRSSRSISPLTRVPTPRRLLFPPPNQTSNQTEIGGTTDRPTLRAVGRQLSKRNQEMASAFDWEERREESRERSRERRGEGFWNLANAGQNQSSEAILEDGPQYRGSFEEREQDWTTISISGSSEEGEVSSHHENSYDSYSCGQERDTPPRNIHQSSPFLSYRDRHQEWYSQASSTSSASVPVPGLSSSARCSPESAPSLSAEQQRVEQYRQAIQMVQDTCLEASKRYIRAHCVNREAREGGSPDASPDIRTTLEGRSAKKARRRRKLKNRQPSLSFSSASSSPSPSRRRKGQRQAQSQKRTTTFPLSSSSCSPFSSSSPHPKPHDEIRCTDSLLPNISQICTLLWSRSQSLRLHDTSSIEICTARNMYWLLSWAETVAFAVPPTSTGPNSTSGISTGTSVGSSLPGFGESSLENLAASRRWEWRRPVSSSVYQREHEERDPEHAISMWDTLDQSLGEGGYMWRMKTSEEGGGGIEMRESRNGAVWRQQVEEMGRVFEAGGAVCEFLGYGEGVEMIARVRGFYGF